MNDTRPKRRKSKDNPYTLISNVAENIYIIAFKDGKGIYHEEKVNKTLFDAMDKFELEDLSFLNEFDNHIEHSIIYENNLNNRAIQKHKLVEDIVEEKIIVDMIKDQINNLPELQRSRIRKYYMEEMTYDAIAKEEKCTKRAIKFSVDIGIEKISKKMKN